MPKHVSAHPYLKSGCVLVSGFMSSRSFSSVGIQDGDRWQFWRSTQVPRRRAVLIRAAALGPCISVRREGGGPEEECVHALVSV